MKNIRKAVMTAITLGLALTAQVHAASEWVRGEIVKLAPQKSQVTVRHEAIKSMGMDAMTMPYSVANAAVLQGFKVGDPVRFTVTMQGDQMRIERLEHAR